MSEEEDNISEMDSETDLEGGTEIPMGLLDEVGECFVWPHSDVYGQFKLVGLVPDAW